MLKKIISLVFCLAFFCAFAASCDRMTNTETFFRMYEDMNKLPEAKFSATLDFDVATDTLTEGSADTSGYAALFGDQLKGSLQFEGGYSLDKNQSYATASIDMGNMDGEVTDIITDDGDTYYNVSTLLSTLFSGFSDMYATYGLSADEITKAYTDVLTSDYVLVKGNSGDSESLRTLFLGTFEKAKEQALRAKPELVTKENGKYVLSVDGKTAADLIIAVLEDMKDNAGEYADALNAYAGSLSQDTGIQGETLDKDTLSASLDELISQLKSVDEEDFELTMTMSYDRTSKEYSFSFELSSDEASCTFTMTSAQAKYDGPSVPDSYMTEDEYAAAFASVDLMSLSGSDDDSTTPGGNSGAVVNPAIGDLEGNGKVDTVYTGGYSTLLYPDLTYTSGIVTYTLTDSYGYTSYLPVIDGGTVASDYNYVEATFDSLDLYYELVDGSGYTPSTYMAEYPAYLSDYFTTNAGYTDVSFSDIYVNADNSLALIVTYYYYDGEPYYDIMGVANSGSSEFVFFEYSYMDNYISSDMYSQLDTILSFTGAW